jgi:hypothetical protein
MPKLNDTQLILLSTASQHPNGSFYPLPPSLADAGDRATKAIAAVAKLALAEERETCEPTTVYRTDGDLRYGMFITKAGIKAIDAGPDSNRDQVTTPTASRPERQSKTAAVIALLQRDGGASSVESIEATGWLPHTTRAALTGLRKKGHVIERSKRGDDTCYRIAAAA